MIESYSNPRKTREVFQFALQKIFWDLGLGFSVDVVRMREGLSFLGILLWRHRPDNGPKLWLKLWLYCRLEYEAVEA